jgi:hypothetical protein
MTKEKVRHIELKTNPNDSWAEVELYRWQYGELPKYDSELPLSVKAGYSNMVNAIDSAITSGNPGDLPDFSNVLSVLKYVKKYMPDNNGRENK